MKKVVQDIVPGERRSIRKITIERDEEPKINPRTTTRRKIVQPIEEVDEIVEEEIIEKIQSRKNKPTSDSKPGKKTLIAFGITLICIVIIGIALSLSYSKAVVTITPKVTNFDVNGTFTAKKVGPSNMTDDFTYDVVTATDEVKQSIAAVKGPLVQSKAKGTAVIYNNYSASSQTLVAGTRLSTSDGLIYRTSGTVVVPGKKTSPGSIAVNIVADQVGDRYNIKAADLKSDLKLPGYQGSAKYAGFYARLKTDVTGGYSGNKMTIDPVAKADAIKGMQEKLKTQLVEKLSNVITPNTILYKDSYTFDFNIPEPVMKTASEAEIVVKGTIYGAVFNDEQLIKSIAGKEIRKFPSDTYSIDGDRELAFSISNSKDFSAKKGTPLIFTLKGPISITGTISEKKLKEELKGIKLKDSSAIFAKYPSIANAYALITPFWLRTFPSSEDKINIEYRH